METQDNKRRNGDETARKAFFQGGVYMRGVCAHRSFPVLRRCTKAHRTDHGQPQERSPSRHSQPGARMPAIPTNRQHAKPPTHTPLPTMAHTPRGTTSLDDDCDSADRRSCPHPLFTCGFFASRCGLILVRFSLSRRETAAVAAAPEGTTAPPRERNARVTRP